MKYTAAHWGAFQFDGKGGLQPLGDDPSPPRIGNGWVSAAKDKKSRILAPMARKGWLEGDKGANRCRDSFVEISWETAIKTTTSEITRVKDEYGNSAIFGGSYGWSSAGRFHHAQSQMRRFLNLAGGYVSSRDTYSHAVAEVLLPHIFGMSMREYQDNLTSYSQIEKHCQTMLCFGGISGRTAQITSAGTSLHDAESWLDRIVAQGTRVINVSPIKTDFNNENADWVSNRPGTDTALILALSFEIIKAGREDKEFLKNCTSGWQTYKAYLLGKGDGIEKSANWASPICDMSAENIRALAMDLVSTRTMISMTWSVQRGDHGEQPLWAAIGLACIIGQIGQPGLGFAFGYGCMATLGRPKKLTPWPSFQQGKNLVSDFIPVARIADMLLHPGEDYLYNGARRTYPDTKLIYWTGGNPFHHHQDLNRLETAWAVPETVIVNDHSWTATARRADIVLPATTPLERADIMMNRRDPSLIYMSPLFEPLGKSKDDFEIFKLLSAEMGFEDEFTEGLNTGEWLQKLWSEAEGIAQDNGFLLPSLEEFERSGRFDIPDAEEEKNFLEDFAADPREHRLRTESGTITLSNNKIGGMDMADCPSHPVWIPPIESLIDAQTEELHLISNQPDTRLHSQNDRGSESLKSKICDREAVYLHPKTAEERGLNEDDIVMLFNDRGACLAGLRFDSAIRRDCIVLATGAWFDPQEIDGENIEVHGNPNVLTIDKGTSALSQGNIAHTALVRVEKWTKPLPELKISAPPIINPMN